MTKVYVLNYGVAAYEDNVFTVGVFSTPENALKGVEQGRKPYGSARYGEYWYDISEFVIDEDVV